MGRTDLDIKVVAMACGEGCEDEQQQKEEGK
jgi:hypothetical protein